MGGLVLETNLEEIMHRIADQNRIEKQMVGLAIDSESMIAI